MRTFTKEELKAICDRHVKWLRGEPDGEKADLRGSNLRGSNLRGSNLRGSDLRGSDLRGSDLSYSDLSYSDLSYSDLSYSDLSCSDLRDSDLSCSNLRGSNLRGSKGGSVCRMDFGGWTICVRADKTSIGCQTMENYLWLRANPKDVKSMGSGASEWWELHGPVVKSAIEVVMEKAKAEGGSE